MLYRLCGGVQLTEPHLRQAKVRPRRRLARYQPRHVCELLPGVVQETDLEGCEAVIKRACRLFVGLSSRLRERSAPHDDQGGDREYRDDNRGNDPGRSTSRGQDAADAPAP